MLLNSYPTLNPSPFHGEGNELFPPLYVVERGKGVR